MRNALDTCVRGAGTTEATACVTLWNEGEDAYRPHEFGRSIEIERRISERGGNSFKLKNSQGKTVASGNSAVKELLTHFQIDASNPVVCLTQVCCHLTLQFLACH